MTVARLQLLGAFEVRIDDDVAVLPRPAERMLAFLALRRQPQTRCAVAAAVWHGTPTARALARLDALCGELPAPVRERISVRGDGRLALDERWSVDLDDALDAARRLHEDPEPRGSDVVLLRLELLPSWYDPWLHDVQDRYHRLRLAVLQRIGRHLLDAGDCDGAVDIALELVAEDELREDAHHLLVAGLASRGDLGQARRSFDRFRARLRRDLGVDPSPRMLELVARLQHPAGQAQRA